MKKIYILVFVLIAACVYCVHAQTIKGPSTVCSGTTTTYTVVSGPSCMVQLDGPEGLNQGTYSSTPGTWTFSITWVNNTTASIVDNFNIYISADYWAGCPTHFVVPMSVTVKPNPSSVATPTTPTLTYVSGKLYTLTTSSSNAVNYAWDITGATISGSSTGSTVNILRNTSSCTITAKVRGYREGCSGPVYSSFSGTTSYTVPATPFSYIDGTSFLYPYAYVSYTPFFLHANSEQGSVTQWSLSDPGGKLTLSPSGNTAYISNGAPTATLYFAVLTCTVSNGCNTKTVSKTLTYGGMSGSSVLYPNPSRAGQSITLDIPEASEIDQYQILDQNGVVIRQNKIIPQNESITIESLAHGLYIIKLIRKGDLIETKRFTVN